MATTRTNPTKTQHKKGGERKAPPAASSNGSSPEQRETLRKLYACLLRSREIQKRLQARVGLPVYELSLGHEAVVVGTTADLECEDTITACRWNVAALIARRVPWKALLAAGAADEACACEARATVAHTSLPQDPFHLGTGIALAHRLENKHRVVVAFGGQVESPLEAWHIALKFAGVHKLPILYVIQNGGGTAAEQPAHLEAISFMARDCGFPGVVVDAQDVVAVWRVAQESIVRARNGAGPTLIDCRSDGARDPLAHMEHYLRKRDLWDEAWREQTAARISQELEVVK